jgi:hypothetical protein
MSNEPMDCSQIRDALLAGSNPEGPGVSAHLRDCEACEELLRDEGALGRALTQSETPAPTDDALFASLERAVRAETGPRAWLRSRATPVRLAVAALAATGVVVFGGLAVRDTSHSVSGAWLVAFALSALACLRLLVAPLGRPRRAPGARAALVALALALPLGYAALSLAPPSPSTGSAAIGFAEQAFACFSYGTFLALPFLAVLFAIERSDRPWLVLLAGFGAVAGLVANTALALHCPNTEPAHLALGHATIGTSLAALGALWALATRRS